MRSVFSMQLNGVFYVFKRFFVSFALGVTALQFWTKRKKSVFIFLYILRKNSDIS